MTHFTPREQDVLTELGRGHSNKVIAHKIGMAEATVKVHLRRIMKKVSARNRTQVVLWTLAHDAPAT